MTNDKIEVQIENPEWRELNGYRFYLTRELYERLSVETGQEGETRLSLLKKGKLTKGFKHLITVFSSKGTQNNLVLSDQPSIKVQNDYYVNFDEFAKIARSRFYESYHQTLLNAANFVLSQDFPQDFSYKEQPVVALTDKNFEHTFSISVKKLAKRPKHRTTIYKGARETITHIDKEIKLKKQELEELKKLIDASNITYFRTKLDEFKSRLKSDLPETKGPNSWQKWVYDNNWLFGIKYHPPIQKDRAGFDQIPDFLFPTTDGFLDILEIKKPSFDVINEDKSHPGAFQWSTNTNQAIGQVVNYIHEIETHHREIQERIKDNYSINTHAIKPRAFILIGNSSDWEEKKLRSLRKMNYSLHGIDVITYSELLNRGQEIIDMYTKKIG